MALGASLFASFVCESPHVRPYLYVYTTALSSWTLWGGRERSSSHQLILPKASSP